MTAGPVGPEASTNAVDRGSSTPFVLLCFLIVLLVVAGTTATSSAFLARRDLQADCDGAALAAVNGLEPAGFYGARTMPTAVPLAEAAANQAVQVYAAALPAGPATTFTVGVEAADAGAGSGPVVSVRCERIVPLALGRLVGVPDGVDLTALSSAAAPIRT
jgi:hypothetical protein